VIIQDPVHNLKVSLYTGSILNDGGADVIRRRLAILP